MAKRKLLSVLKIVLICIIILAITIPTTLIKNNSLAFADDPTELTAPTDGKTRSIQKEYFMGIFMKKINNGKPVVFFTEGYDSEQERAWEEKRKELNYNIAKNNDNTKYSLYDRFGGNISFVKYLGEDTIAVNILDKYYTHVAETMGHEWLVFEGIHTAWDLIFKDNTQYTNIFYQGRPILKQAAYDPRTLLYKIKAPVDIGTGVEVGTANYFLLNAKIITDICTFFVDNTLLDFSFSKIKDLLNSKELKTLSPVVSLLLFFVGLILIIFVIRFVIKFVKSGQASIKQFILNLFGALLSFGIVITLIYNPTVFMDVTKDIIVWADKNITDVAGQGDPELFHQDIAASEDPASLKKTAQLWFDAIFQPWVQGEFNGVKYDQLYTTYAQVDDNKKWDVPQDAAESYGDITVPRGGDKATTGIKNWAALAYSCQSVYHIDAVDDMDIKDDPDAKNQWPKAAMPYGIDFIYNDDFRWIDASLKVGHIAGNNGGVAKTSYTDPWDADTYLQYRFRGVEFGWRAIYLSLLMIPIGVIGVKKTLALLLSLVNFFLLLYRCMLNVFFPDKEQYSILKSFKAMLMPLASYIFYIILLIIGIKFYNICCDSGNFLVEMMCFALTIYLATLKLEVIPKVTRAVKNRGKQLAEYGSSFGRRVRDANLTDKYNKFVNGPTSTRKRLATSEHDEEARANAQKQKEKLDEDEARAEEAKRAAEHPEDYKYKSGENDATASFVDDQGRIQGDGKLTKHDYCDAVMSEINKRIKNSSLSRWQQEEVFNMYNELCEALRKTSYETEIINQHRMDPEHKRLDHLVLGIGPDEFAKGTNTGYNSVANAARMQKRREMKQEMVLEKYARKEKELDDNFEEDLQGMRDKLDRGEISTEEWNRYKKGKEDDLDLKKKALRSKKEKEYKKEGKRDKGWEKGQEYMNLLTGGKHMTGKHIPLKVKFYILVGAIGLWLILWLIAIIVGV